MSKNYCYYFIFFWFRFLSSHFFFLYFEKFPWLFYTKWWESFVYFPSPLVYVIDHLSCLSECDLCPFKMVYTTLNLTGLFFPSTLGLYFPLSLLLLENDRSFSSTKHLNLLAFWTFLSAGHKYKGVLTKFSFNVVSSSTWKTHWFSSDLRHTRSSY